MRADAARNRARILQAARDQIEMHGTECSLDTIAKQAGVGPGTLYRHFPTRDALLSELLLSWVGDVQADAEKTTADTRESVLDWLVSLAQHAMTYRGLSSSMAATEGDDSSPLRSAHAAVLEANSVVFDRAERFGVVRAPVNSGEIGHLVTGVAMISEQARLTSAQLRSMLAIILGGLSHPG